MTVEASPTILANMALDALGADFQLGSIEEGGKIGNVMLRAYGRCRDELLRAAPWAFARRQEPLVLLADSSGSTPLVGTQVPGTNFQYEYAYPGDAARIRYIPWNPFSNPGTPAGNIVPPNNQAPLTSVPAAPSVRWAPIRPSLFVITNDPNFPAQPGSNWPSQQGKSPTGSTVILSNVPQASCVYTFNAIYPSLWDSLFFGAMVAFLASEVALGVLANKRRDALEIRKEQIQIAKAKIMEARVVDGNEMSVSTSHIPDWIRARYSGGSRWEGWNSNSSVGGWGCFGSGWSGACSFSDGSSY